MNGDVYFDVRSFDNYCKLSCRDLDEMRAGSRVGVDERKKDPMDFALWKSAKPGEPSWKSPWGLGRPGWHIECSAMSIKYLGMGFDIHGGGFDLIFPHHENEIAQSEAYTGTAPFVNYWMHNGFITINEEKMSKSLGNFFTVREILAKYQPKIVRFFMLNTHYRSPLDFDDSKLEMSKKSLERLENAIAGLQGFLNSSLAKEASVGPKGKTEEKLEEFLKQIKDNFIKAMDDDFNTALAIAQLFDLSKEINTLVNNLLQNKGTVNTATVEVLVKVKDEFLALGDVLGLLNDNATSADNQDELVNGLLDLIIDIRQTARSNKDWGTADKIRDSLKEVGIVLEDSPQGVRWKKV
jgi:cysteinyl-tRNA synthetase